MFYRRFRDKKEAVEPEADPERDQRTVFAYQVGWLVDSIFVLFKIIIILSFTYFDIWHFFDDCIFALVISDANESNIERCI